MAETSTSPKPGSERQLAALDLGSNSFHLLVAQESGGRIQVIDKMKEMVRLADSACLELRAAVIARGPLE